MLSSSIKPNIKSALLYKLEKARNNIKLNKFNYIDNEHKQMCLYHKKYIEIKNSEEYKKLYENHMKFQDLKKESVKIDKRIHDYNDKYIELQNSEEYKKMVKYHEKYMEIKKNLKLEKKIIPITYKNFHIYQGKIKTTDIIYEHTAYYNEYNENFINNLNTKYDIDIIKDFIREQEDFIRSLSIYELYTLKYYTDTGDILLKDYLNGDFKINEINNLEVNNNNYYNLDQMYNSYSIKHDSYLIFFYQFSYIFNKIIEDEKTDKYDIFEKYDITRDYSKREFKNFILSNYEEIDIEIYHMVFEKYINDIIVIFNKAPILKNELITYRGIKKKNIKDIINLKKGSFMNSTFMSTSLFDNVAKTFTNDEDGYVQRINLGSSPNRVIFMELITLHRNEFEVLLPINSILYIDYRFRKMQLYDVSSNDNFICENEFDPNNSKIYNIMDNILLNKNKLPKYKLEKKY